MASSKTPKTPIERIAAAQSDLKSLRRRFQLGTWLTVIVGFGLLALLTAYFTIGYREISRFRDPDLIVSYVGQTIDDGLPRLRQQIQQRVDSDAPVWAEQASQQVLVMMPSFRKSAEEYACQQAEAAIDRIDVVGEREFRRILDENRDTVNRAIKDLENEHEVSDGVVLMLEEAIQKELQLSMEQQAAALLEIVKDVNKNMKQILANENLTAEQLAERRVLMLAKRLQQERFSDVRLDNLSSPVLTGIVEDMERTRLKQKASSDKAEASADEGEAASDEQAQPKEQAAAEKKEETPEKKDTEPKGDASPKPEANPAAPPEAEKTDVAKAESKPAADKQ